MRARQEIVAADLAREGEATRLVGGRPDIIFHLAAIVSGEAEADFEKGYRVNLDGTRNLFEAIRKACRNVAIVHGLSSPLPSRCSERRFLNRSMTSS